MGTFGMLEVDGYISKHKLGADGTGKFYLTNKGKELLEDM